MNRKIVCVLLFVAILFISLLTVTHPVNSEIHQVSTDGFPTVSAGGFTIVSPHNRTYTSNHLPLMITLVCTGFSGAITYSLNYSIDGKYQGPIHKSI